MKKYLKHINGGMMFLVSIALFFLVPPLYRLVDPTAGQYDAGILHNLFIGAIYVSFSCGFAWFCTKFVAPGVHKSLDEYVETGMMETPPTDQVMIGLILYILFFVASVLTILFV